MQNLSAYLAQARIKWKDRVLWGPFSLKRDLGWNFGCSRVESRSSKRIFAWARLVLGQARLSVNKKVKTESFIFAFKMLVYLFMYSFTYKLCELLFHIYLIENFFNYTFIWVVNEMLCVLEILKFGMIWLFDVGYCEIQNMNFNQDIVFSGKKISCYDCLGCALTKDSSRMRYPNSSKIMESYRWSYSGGEIRRRFIWMSKLFER